MLRRLYDRLLRTDGLAACAELERVRSERERTGHDIHGGTSDSSDTSDPVVPAEGLPGRQ